MDSFNFGRLRDYIPTELPWSSSLSSMNPDDIEGLQIDDAMERQDDAITMVLNDPIPIGGGPKSYLDLVNECDNFPYYQTNPKLFFAHVNTYYGLCVKDYPDTELGYVLPSVANVFRGLPDWEINDEERCLTLISGNNEEERTKIVAATTEAMRATGHFQVLAGWRNELYPVFGKGGDLLFSLERSASPLFGIVTYGCHMTAYTKDPSGEHNDPLAIKIWVPRRAATKQTYGGMLDNTVAGGLATGEKPFECLVRECAEEANLPEELVRRTAKAAGTVTYFHIRDHRAGGETRLLQPECEYVFDMELPADVIPKPNDDEVEGFELMTVEGVKEAMRKGEFKPNCAVVLIDFMIRHGLISMETDPGYIEIIARIHRKLEFPTP